MPKQSELIPVQSGVDTQGVRHAPSEIFERVEICPQMTILKSKLQSQTRENIFHYFIVMF